MLTLENLNVDDKVVQQNKNSYKNQYQQISTVFMHVVNIKIAF